MPSSAPRHRNGTGRCAKSGASRPVPLQHRAKQAQMANRLYLSLDEKRGSGHSGVVNLQLREPRKKYYLIAAMRDSYFRAQLDAKTPRGSTIRHSGDGFLTCLVPDLRESEDWVYHACAALARNIAYAERAAYARIVTATDLIDQE